MRKSKHKVGDRFGNLEIIENLGLRKANNKTNSKTATYYKCRCLINANGCNFHIEVKAADITKKAITNCGNHLCSKRFNDLTGRKFGKLFVIAFDKLVACQGRNNANWICICDCGNECNILHKYLIDGSRKSCGCLGNNARDRSYMELSGHYYTSVKSHALSRNFCFEVSPQDCWNQFIKQNKKCALTGIPLTQVVFGKKYKWVDGDASLDRIDSEKGYTIDNIQWIHKLLNRMKMDLDQGEFINWCKLVAKHNGDK